MSRIILATTQPLSYGSEKLSKQAASLKKVASRKSLPLVLEHDGPKVGTVTNLAYEFRDGVGYLLGTIADFMGKVGSSLQYSGSRLGDQIRVTSVDHVALVDTPRDPVAVFSDSSTTVNKYRDSVDESEVEPEVGPENPPQPENPEGGTEIELTDEVVDQIYGLLFNDPKRLADLMSKIKGTETENTEPETDEREEAVPKTPTRIIVKPRTAQEPVVKKAPLPIQRPFKALR